MRGSRCPEFAAEDFYAFIVKLFEEHASVSLLELFPRLDDSERTSIMMDFGRSWQHLTTTSTLKLAHWKKVHFHIFGIAHCDKEKSMRCYWKAKRSASKHPNPEELRSPYLDEDLLQWDEAIGGLDVQLGA